MSSSKVRMRLGSAVVLVSLCMPWLDKVWQQTTLPNLGDDPMVHAAFTISFAASLLLLVASFAVRHAERFALLGGVACLASTVGFLVSGTRAIATLTADAPMSTGWLNVLSLIGPGFWLCLAGSVIILSSAGRKDEDDISPG